VRRLCNQHAHASSWRCGGALTCWRLAGGSQRADAQLARPLVARDELAHAERARRIDARALRESTLMCCARERDPPRLVTRGRETIPPRRRPAQARTSTRSRRSSCGSPSCCAKTRSRCLTPCLLHAFSSRARTR
jgi:hypothetical protein